MSLNASEIEARQRYQTMRLLSQRRTAFAPRFYEIKERDLTLCACQLKGKQLKIEVKDEQLPLSINPFAAKFFPFDELNGLALDRVKSIKSPMAVKELRRNTAGKWHTTRQHEQKGRIQVDTLDLDWSAQQLCMTFA